MKSKLHGLLWLLPLLILGNLGSAATITWINPAGGNWSNTNNWSPNQVPGSADTAVIDIDADYTVTLDVSATVTNFVLGTPGGIHSPVFSMSSSTLAVSGQFTEYPQGLFNLTGGTLNGTLSVAGTLNWSGGALADGGSVTMATNAVLNISGGNNLQLFCALTNAGTVNWAGTGNLQIVNGGGYPGVINNLAGAVFNIENNETLQSAYNDEYFYNAGFVRKSGATGNTMIQVAFNNTGMLDVASGTVSLNNGGTGSGQFVAETGATVEIGNNYSASASATFSGAGTNLWTSGNIIINGPVLTTNSVLTGGNLTGGAIFSGLFTWTGGTIAPGATLTVATNGVLDITGGNNLELEGGLTNAGTVNWMGTGNLQMINGNGYTGVINNLARAVFNIQNDQTLQDYYGDEYFYNAGLVRKSVSAGTTTLQVAFENTGTLEVQSGEVTLNGGGAGSGQFTANAGATLGIGNNYAASSAALFSGAGTNLWTGGTITINGPVLTTNSMFTGGTLTGDAIFSGLLTWTGGIIGNGATLTVATNAVLNITGGNNLQLEGGLTNAGTVNWTGTDNLQMINGNGSTGVINNLAGAVFNIQNDQTLQDYYGDEYFYNAGLVRKSVTIGTTTLQVAFDNTGTVEAQSGELTLNGGGAGSGEFLANAGATLGIGNNYAASSAALFSGAGTNLWTGGTITINGPVLTTNSVLTGGTLTGGAIFSGLLTWTGGIIGSGATLTVATNAVLNITGGNNLQLVGGLTNAGTVNWTGTGNLQMINGNGYTGVINNLAGAVFNIQNDQTLQDYYGDEYFYNAGLVRKSVTAGTTTLQVAFENTGTLDVASGTVSLTASSLLSGSGQFIGAGQTLLSGGTFTFNGSLNSSNLIWAGGTFQGNATVNGLLTWTGGILSGGSLTVASNSTLLVTGTADHDLPQSVLTNNGTVQWINGRIRGGGSPGTTVYNYGLWIAQSDQIFNDDYGNSGVVFNNYGTFRKSGGASTGDTLFNSGVLFNQLAGVLDVQSGAGGLNLYLQGNGNFTGGYITTNSGGLTWLLSGNFTLDGTVTTTNVIQNGGNLVGTVLINSGLTWEAGVWNSAASVTILSNSVVFANGTADHDMASTVVTNYGAFQWSNGRLRGGGSPGTTVWNYGLWNAQGDETFNDDYGGSGTVFNNYGAFRKTAGTNTSYTLISGGVLFNQLAGVLDVQSGNGGLNLQLQGSGNFTGGYLTTNNSALTYLSSGNFNINGTAISTNVIEAGANLAGTNVLNGGLTWQSGIWNSVASVTIPSNSTVYVNGTADHDMAGSVVTNNGTVVWLAGRFRGGGNPGTAVYNQGLWNAECDQIFNDDYGAAGTVFNNAGVVRKWPTTNTTTFAVTFANTGTVDVESGTVSLTANNSLATGTLNLGIYGPANYGQLAISGSATLTGGLNVVLHNGYIPVVSNSFTLVTFGSESGTFSPVSLPLSGSFWQVLYTNTSVDLVLANNLTSLVNIACLRSLLDPVNFAPTNTTTLYTTEGVVTTTTNLTGGASSEFFIQDATAGIAVYWAGAPASSSLPPAGSFVQVTAPLAELNGQLTLMPAQTNFQEGVTIFASTNLPAPQSLVFDTNITSHPALMVQHLAGSYFVASNVFLNLSTATFAAGAAESLTNAANQTNFVSFYNPTNLASGTNYTLTATNLAGETFTIAYNPYTDIIGKAKHAGPYTIYGVLGQYATNVPYTSGYQFTPTRIADIIPLAPPVINWTNPLPITYGTGLGATQLNATATFGGTNVAGSYVYNPPAGSVLSAGTTLLGVTFTPADLTHFNSSTGVVSMVVLPASLSVAANNTNRSYGAASPAFTGTLTGVVNGDNITAAFTTTAGIGSPVGTYPINPQLVDPNNRLANYTLTSSSNGVLTVTTVPLSVTANNTSRLAGQNNPTFTGTILGVVNGDNISAAYSCAATPGSPVGTYPIIPALLDPNGRLGNYVVTVTNGTLTVNITTLSVTWPAPAPIYYGMALGAADLNASANLPGSFAYTPAAGALFNAGTNMLTVVFSPTDTVDFNNATSHVSLVVLPAPLTVTGSNYSRMYGQTNPLFGGIITGLTNGDIITATYATAATSNSSVGTYPIVPTLVDTNSRLANYTVATNDGTLTVIGLLPQITWSASVPIAYGTVLSGTQLDASASVAGSFVYSPPAGTVLSAGTNTLTAMFTPVDQTNYSSASATVSFVVTRVPLTVTANNASRTYGQANPTFTGTLAGLVNGDVISATYNCSAVTFSPPGTYPIVPSLFDPSDLLGNYSVASTNGTLTVSGSPTPTLLFTTPNQGLTNGGTSITLVGSGFEAGALACLGGQPAASTVVNSGSQITVVTAPGPLGATSVTVTNPDNTHVTLTNGFTYIGPPPSIVTQPASEVVIQGSNAVFSVNAPGATGWQWLFGGVNLTDGGRVSGSHSSVLTIAGAQPADAGNYQVIVNNAYGSTAGTVATLSVITAPGILTPPQNQTVGQGGVAIFTVTASGTPPFNYQWLQGGVPLTGQTNSALILNSVPAGDQGLQYSVTVGNPAGVATSTAATLTVLSYCASAQPGQAVYPMGSVVPLSVQTVNCTSGSPVPNSSATVWVSMGNTIRSLPVVTGASGSNMVNFVPLPTEAGTYQVAAALPGQSIPLAQGTFSLVGMSLSPGSLTSVLTPGIPVTNSISLMNLTSIGLTGVNASVVGSTPDVQVTLNASGSVPGNGAGLLTVVLEAPGNSPAQDQFSIQLTTAQGTTNLIPVTATVSPLYPQLAATPASLSATMVAGGQTLVNFFVANSGGVTSGPVQVLLPPVPWLTTVTPMPLPPMAPGQSNTVTLALTPPGNLPLGAYTGSLELTSSNAYAAVPYQFNCISALTGSLLVTVQDELSYYESNSPGVSNATITVTDFLTGSNVTSGVTGASGAMLFTNLTSAYYTIDITAPDHGSFGTTLLVQPNQTNDLTAFLNLQLVDYTWVVTPTIIPDHYVFTLDTIFQTQVPWPVVTVNPGAIDLCTMQGETNEVNLAITNSGLIAAQGLELYFGSHPDWSIQPLVTSLGDLAPESSIVVPVTIIRTNSTEGVPDQITAQLSFHVYTPTQTNNTVVPIYVYDANPADCLPAAPTPAPVVTTCSTCGAVASGGGGGGSGPGAGGGGGSGSGGGGGPGLPSIQSPNYMFTTPEGAIVQVKLQIQQSAVIARDAFNASLQLVNGAGGTISNLSAGITVYDTSNNVANNLFGIPAAALSGLNAVNGTGVLANGATGSVAWTIVPATNAAPTTPTPFSVGGYFSYVLNGQTVTVPLFPVPITVLPTPILNVDYFLQHDVYSDDPFTPQIEPSIPFPLGIRVHNIGFGDAYDFTITSAQPEIIQNSNDLLIAFQLIGSQVGTNQSLSPSFTLDLGNIGPGGSSDGLWYMTSTLEGQFIAFSASYQHVDDFGNTNTSLINALNIHEMNHVVELTELVDDGLPDFLVNDTTNVDALPQVVYSSDGTTDSVTSVTNGISTIGAPSATVTNITVNVPATPGWGYFEIVDPGNDNYPIASVTRSDGEKLLVGPNVWQTPERLHMIPPKPNNLIHIFDYNSTGSYTVTYGLPILAPAVTTLNALSITPTNATLNALVNPNGANTDVYFQWGATTNYGNMTFVNTLTESLNEAQSVSLAVGSLLPNGTNHFRAVGINSAGTTFGSDLAFVTLSLPPPAITQVSNQVSTVGQALVISNRVQVATLPAIFSLSSSDPAGASISTNGVFRWTPTCEEGSSTNVITIWVADSSAPPLSNFMMFSVVVGQCVELELGSTALQVGTTSGVPVTLLSSVGLTNLTWTLNNSFNRLTNFTFAASNSAIARVSSSQTFFSLGTVGGTPLQSPSLLGTIYFSALPGPSAFLSLVATNILGTEASGRTVGNISSGAGTVAVVGVQPLLQAMLGASSTRTLILYDNPGTNYQLLVSTNLTGTNWPMAAGGMVTNLIEYFNVDPTPPSIYFRAK